MNNKVEMLQFKVKGIGLAKWGRKEINLAEMRCGLMQIRENIQKEAVKGARIAGCLHMTIQTAALKLS